MARYLKLNLALGKKYKHPIGTLKYLDQYLSRFPRKSQDLTSETFYEWCRTLAGEGLDRLRKRKAPGRPSRLSAAQMSEVREIFAAGPRAFGFDADRWTTARLAGAIETRFAIRYDPDHVGRLMHRLGLRPKVAAAARGVRSPSAGMV